MTLPTMPRNGPTPTPDIERLTKIATPGMIGR